MKHFVLFSMVLTFSLGTINQLLAAEFRLEGDVGTLPAGTTGGTIEIVYDAGDTNYSFSNWGIRLELTSETAGVIRFTAAEVINGGRWTAVAASGVADNKVATLEGFSILTPGLPTDTPSIFATVDFAVIGPGTTDLEIAPTGLDPICDCGPGPCSCGPEFFPELVGAAITVVPEPTSGMLGGIACLVAVSLRRRTSLNTR